MRKLIALLWVGCVLLMPVESVPAGDLYFSGKTMGTTYHITVVSPDDGGSRDLQGRISRRLETINLSMSTYREESEISRFNRLDRIGEALCPSADFAAVMAVAADIHRLTGGAWDGTVGPLVALWGFGRIPKAPAVPREPEIVSTRQAVGFDKIARTADGCFSKRHPAVSLDLASIAKGYGVDAVAELIKTAGYANFIVEIGGEVYAAGTRADGTPWRVGINTPRKDAGFAQVYLAVPLRDRALATSGSYRNFFEIDGRTFSHVLDPRTGYPVQNGVVSASVIADNCTLADGLATAIMVMGPRQGIELVDRLDGVECLIVTDDGAGRLVDHFSSGLSRP